MAHSRLMDKLDQYLYNPVTMKYVLRDIKNVYAIDGEQVGRTYLNGYEDKVKVRKLHGYIWEVTG